MASASVASHRQEWDQSTMESILYKTTNEGDGAQGFDETVSAKTTRQSTNSTHSFLALPLSERPSRTPKRPKSWRLFHCSKNKLARNGNNRNRREREREKRRPLWRRKAKDQKPCERDQDHKTVGLQESNQGWLEAAAPGRSSRTSKRPERTERQNQGYENDQNLTRNT